MTVVVEIVGLELPGRHGALEREREREQPFVYDVELELEEPASDELQQTVAERLRLRLVAVRDVRHAAGRVLQRPHADRADAVELAAATALEDPVRPDEQLAAVASGEDADLILRRDRAGD